MAGRLGREHSETLEETTRSVLLTIVMQLDRATTTGDQDEYPALALAISHLAEALNEMVATSTIIKEEGESWL